MNQVGNDETPEKGRFSRTALAFLGLAVAVLLVSWLVSRRGEDADSSRHKDGWESSVYWIGGLETCVQCGGEGRFTRDPRRTQPQKCPNCKGKRKVPEGMNLRYLWVSERISESEFRRRMRVLTDGQDSRD